MGAFQQKWTSEQKEAIEHAWFDRGVRPLRAIHDMARTGQLRDRAGQDLEPFAMPYTTLQDVVKTARKRRAGHAKHELATVPPADAVEALRRRLVSMSATLLDQYERQLLAKPNTADPERLRQIARACREACAMPGPGQTATKPGARNNGERTDHATRGGLAAAILRDASPTPQADPYPTHLPTQEEEGKETHTRKDAAPAVQTDAHVAEQAGPGSLARALDVAQ